MDAIEEKEQQDYIKKKAVAIYSRTLDQIKPDCLKMVFDSFCNYQFHIDNEGTVNPRTKQLDSQFYEKGFEGDKWYQKIQPLLNTNTQTSKRRLSISGLQINYIDVNEIPKKPEAKKLTNFSYKSLEINPNIVTMAMHKKATVDFSKVGLPFVFIEEVFEEDSTLRIMDYTTDKEHSIIVDKFKIDYINDYDEPKVRGLVDLKSFTKRAEMLVNTRFNFIEKYVETMCKFLVSLKKLVKKRKEKEAEQNKTKGTTLGGDYNTRIIAESPFFDEKFVKVKEEIIDNEKKISKKDLNVLKLRDLIKIKETELEEQKTKSKYEKIKEKISNIIKRVNNEDILDEDRKEKKVIFDDNDDRVDKIYTNEPLKSHSIFRESLTNNKKSSEKTVRVNNKLSNNSVSSSGNNTLKKRNDMNDKNDMGKVDERQEEEENKVNEINNDSKNDQGQNDDDSLVIVPKKKIDHLGLKMYIQENLLKNK